MRPSVFALGLAFLALLLAVVLLSPYIGLGDNYDFILYKFAGISRGQAFFWLRVLLVLFCIAQIVITGGSQLHSKQHWISIWRSAGALGKDTTRALFERNGAPPGRTEWTHSILICLFFLAILPLFLLRNMAPLSEQNDLQWYQSFINYDIDWRTPLFALAGNLLNHFGVQVPVNANLDPILRLAHVVSPRFQIITAVGLFSGAMGVLFWSVGQTIGLRPVPCAIFSGTTALLMNIPNGLDKAQIPIGAAVLGMLFWLLGGMLGLRPALRSVFTGLLGLLVIGALRQMYVTPPFLLTHMLILICWWQGASIISLAGAFLFFLLGQKNAVSANLLLGLGFAILCYLVLLAFPAVAVFSVPVIACYCLAFIITSTSKKEFAWKAGTGCILAAAMVLTRIPNYVVNLYSYSWGSYFVEGISRHDRDIQLTDLISFSTAAAFFHADFRIAVVVLVSLGTLCFLVWKASGPLRRLAFSVLFVEFGILLTGAINALMLNLPQGVWYVELFHIPFLVAFFVLFVLFLVTALTLGLDIPETRGRSEPAWVRRLENVLLMLGRFRATNQAGLPSPLWGGIGGGGRGYSNTLRSTTTTPLPSPPPQGGREQAEFAARADSTSPGHALASRYRPALLWAVPLAAIGYYAFFDTAPKGPLKYPPAQPTSVQMLRNELGLQPGQPFRGRVLVLAGMLGKPGNQWPGEPDSIFDVLELQYRPILGNDHYVHLLAFDIPVATDFGHWTSPVTFVLLRKFFGRKDDVVPHKSFFPLRAFNPRVAQLLGIRMVVTDAPSLPETSLVYETKAGTSDLRIFRIDDVNLGQYSPTHVIRASSASEAVATLATELFNPKRDVVVESEMPVELAPATQASVVTDFGAMLSISAEASGWSLLVLPFEYSHCLHLDGQDGTSGKLLPVNLQQTGLLFEKQIKGKLSYRFGPFDHPECRRADLERADRLRLRDAL